MRLRDRRGAKVGRWHDNWVDRTASRADFRPHGRKEGSDYNLHSVDVHAPLDAVINFDRRVREIDGRHPDTGRPLPVPDASERLRGALVAAACGDALGRAVETGTATALPWSPSIQRGDEHALREYVAHVPAGSASAAVQLLAFTLEGLIRAHVAERATGQADPPEQVQHAYQRWLFTQPTPDGQRRDWRSCAGPDAGTSQPDGWLIGVDALHTDAAAPADLVAALEHVARTGQRSSLRDLRAHARGGDVVLRTAAAAVCSADPAEVFTAAVNLAVLTHDRPEDCLAAGVFAVILHQQILDRPFADCLATARALLRRWPGHARVDRKIELGRAMIRDYGVPARREDVHIPFPGGGSDGADALGLALYCAMASDYVREAVQLAVNYAPQRPVVAAMAAGLLGAECGVQAVPADLRDAAPVAAILDTLAQDARAEFSTTPPSHDDWVRRYPAS